VSGVRMFASDNASGAHPDVMAALAEANRGHVHAYGYDEWTRRAVEVVRERVGAPAAAVHFVFNGTGANVTGLQAVMRSYEAVICPVTAHINVDECGAPERFTGGKLLAVTTPDGKLTPDLVESAISGIGVEHHSQPRVVSITQSTEYGTTYRPEEVRALADVAHAHGLVLHMDGARISNAAAFLGCDLAQITSDVGVDVLSLGGAKNGLLFGEAVVFFDAQRAADFLFIRKQSAQLASKMRFISAQFIALFGGGLWRENAAHANAMARELADGLRGVPGVRLTQPVEANEVFAVMARPLAERLRAVADFYAWDERANEHRMVASWDTTADDVERFVEAARAFVE
jgi:threonine aldolase